MNKQEQSWLQTLDPELIKLVLLMEGWSLQKPEDLPEYFRTGFDSWYKKGKHDLLLCSNTREDWHHLMIKAIDRVAQVEEWSFFETLGYFATGCKIKMPTIADGTSDAAALLAWAQRCSPEEIEKTTTWLEEVQSERGSILTDKN